MAREYLEKQGYKFVTANWKCKGGEVDLVMRDKDWLVFVEVRTRSVTNFGTGGETVAWDKQKKLIRTARVYQQKENFWGDIRFDVVSIEIQPDGKFELDHIDYAFEAC